MKECLDEGMLQAWLDGELSGESAEKTAAHLMSCMTCAEAMREMQSEAALIATALAPEFDVIVPTERLRTRIESAIAELQPNPVRAQSTGRSWLQEFIDSFAVSPQRAFSYAAIAAVLIAVVALGVIYLKRSEVSRGVEIANHDQPVTPGRSPLSTPVPVETPDRSVIAGGAPKKSLKRHSKREDATAPALIPGEQDYLKTIAALDATIKSDVRSMRPATQVEYQHNLAVVNQAIANTRGVAQKNPNDPDTAKFVMSAYQSKVDLLTQVADARLFNPQQK
jgi:anti-sigma factor RsiW